MQRTMMLSFALTVGLLSVSVAQEVRERVRAALSYPPLMGEARTEFVIDEALPRNPSLAHRRAGSAG